MRDLFISVNMDSYKSSNYINIPELEKDTYDNFKEELNKKYKSYFAKSINKKNQLYTISEFMDRIFPILNSNFTIQNLEKINNDYNKKIGYKSIYLEDSSRFYKEEQEILLKDRFFSFGFKNNNFFDYLFKKNIIPEHIKFKKLKSKISSKLRDEVWKKEYKDLIEGKCPIKNCKHIIYKTNFNCGHIISEYNGGETNLQNLRPICTYCNSKMGINNWIN
jgi:hypothetical protein